MYYPTYWSGCNPIHGVTSWLKVRNLLRAVIRGDKIPPILIDGGLGNGNLLTGTHRSAANDIIMTMRDSGRRGWDKINLIDWSEPDYTIEGLRDAVDSSDYERINDIMDN